LKVKVVAPTGDIVLFRQLPTKQFSETKPVDGAYKHTFELTSGGDTQVRVVVRMHVRVKSKDELLTNKLWKVKILPCKVDNEVGLILSPASKGSRANVSDIELKEVQAKDRTVTLELCEIVRKEKPISTRRHARAAFEANQNIAQ